MVFDTNVVLDYFKGLPEARKVLEAEHQPAMSAITYAEVLVGVPKERFEEMKAALRKFTLIPVAKDISEQAAIIRRETRLKLPDAIILATAKVLGTLLVTRDKKDFGAMESFVRVPYQI